MKVSRIARIRRLLYSDVGRVFLSILLALGLATIFRRSCTSDECIVRKVPSRYDMHETVYKEGGDCYRVKLRESECRGDVEYLIE